MPRKPRIEYAGGIYHVMSRGNRGEAIFEDDTDRKMFLETLGQARSKTGWIIHCYVLMCHNPKRAGQLKAKALEALRLTEDVLDALPKGCPEKQVLVWFIHTRTSVPNDWLCQQLHCGHAGNVSKYAKAVAVAKDKRAETLKRRILKSGD